MFFHAFGAQKYLQSHFPVSAQAGTVSPADHRRPLCGGLDCAGHLPKLRPKAKSRKRWDQQKENLIMIDHFNDIWLV